MQRQILKNLLSDSTCLGQDLMEDRSHFCFSCEQNFPNRTWLEEHSCPVASHICSCGTEFSVYMDMLEHSTTHEPGHKVLDHKTIMKRRFEKHREQEEQLRRLQSAEQGLWAVPRLKNVPEPSLTKGSKSKVLTESVVMPQVPIQSAAIIQVPVLPPPISQGPLPHNSMPPALGTSNLLTDSSAPTVDLWPLYQPVVVLKRQRPFDKNKPYNCGKCGQGFTTKSSVVLHHNTHAKDKVVGCLGCGLLLSSKKSVPRFHQCNSASSFLKSGLVTAQPMHNKKPIKADTKRSLQPGASNKQHRQLTVPPKELWWKPPSHSGWQGPTQAASPRNTLICRVCHVSYGSVQLLQRHKCIKAQEFVKMQALSGMQSNRHMKVTAMRGPYLYPQINGNKKLGAPAFSNMKLYQHKAGGLGAHPVCGKRDGDLENDCYIVGSSPAKPAQMFYRLTSPLPIIKT